MKKKTKIILGLILLLLVVVIGTTYAFFTASVTTTGEDKTTEITAKAYANATMRLGDTINSEDALPGFKAVKKVEITGECQNNADTCNPITAYITVKSTIDNAFMREDGTSDVNWYLIKTDETISCTSQEIEENDQIYTEMSCGGIEELKETAILTGSSTTVLSKEIEVTGQTNDTYYLYVEYANNGEQNEQQGKEFSIKIDFKEEKPKPLNETIILADQTEATDVEEAKTKIKEKGDPDFSTISETDDGLYMAEDDLGESYYFRGNIPDNWVYFANNYWRIIRINGDGSIRMIYNGPTNEQTGETTQVTKMAFNENENNPKYVGYMWGDYNEETQTYVNDNNSTIKDYLENTWFDDALGEFTDYLADEIFCNDRSIAEGDGISTNAYTYYGPNKRIQTDAKPILQCQQANDRFSVELKVGNVETNGQIAQGKPVGLITTDEVMMAGADGTKSENSNYYLYTGKTYWTMSPFNFSSNSNLSCEWHVSGFGYIDSNFVSNTNLGVRPVINLKQNVTIDKGDGTREDVTVQSRDR